MMHPFGLFPQSNPLKAEPYRNLAAVAAYGWIPGGEMSLQLDQRTSAAQPKSLDLNAGGSSALAFNEDLYRLAAAGYGTCPGRLSVAGHFDSGVISSCGGPRRPG